MEPAIKWLARAGDWVGYGAIVAAISAGAVYAYALARRAIDWLMGWPYPIESIAHYLNYRTGTHADTFDKTFLLLVVVGLAIIVWNSIAEFQTWAMKTPEQRRQEREDRRAAQQRRGQRKAEAAVTPKPGRKPMSGWRRLWIVLSILFGLPSYLLAYESYSRAYAPVPWYGDNSAFWSRAKSTPELSGCDWATANAAEPYGGTSYVSCQNSSAMPLLWGLFPAILMAAIGLTARWVYRGFQPHRNGGLARPLRNQNEAPPSREA